MKRSGTHTHTHTDTSKSATETVHPQLRFFFLNVNQSQMGGTDFIVSNGRMSRQNCVTNANDRPRVFPRRFGMQAFMPRPVKSHSWPWTIPCEVKGGNTFCRLHRDVVENQSPFLCAISQKMAELGWHYGSRSIMTGMLLACFQRGCVPQTIEKTTYCTSFYRIGLNDSSPFSLLDKGHW